MVEEYVVGVCCFLVDGGYEVGYCCFFGLVGWGLVRECGEFIVEGWGWLVR